MSNARQRARTPRHDTATPAQGTHDHVDSGAYVLTLRHAGTASLDLVGSKAANLGRLLSEGFPVPEGFVLTTAATRAAAVAASDVSADEAPALPGDVAHALADALATLGDGPVAVRSSSAAEDQSDASYAGQYDSALDVRGSDAVANAVRRCWASAHAQRARAYQGTHVPTEPRRMAVLVQRMVPSDAAGVAFTADPVRGDREAVLVHAVRGHGQRLVAGETDPDVWTLRDGRAEAGETPLAAIDEADARRIADLARDIESLFGVPQDVEWALAAGEVHVLQARPITSLPTPPEIDPPQGPWMKDTVHYTGPISPLAASAYLPRLERGIRRACACGLLAEGVQQAVLGWEVYGQPTPPPDELVPERIAAAADFVRQDRASELVRRWQQEGWRESFIERIAALRGVSLSEVDEAGLDHHLRACLDLLDDGQQAHFQLLLPYLLAGFDLATTCRELLDWDLTSALDLVSGLSEASAAPTLELAELAADVRAHPTAAALVGSWRPDEEASSHIDRLRACAPELAARLRAHLERFGCRVAAYDVGEPTVGERPGRTLAHLRDLVAAGRNPLETRRALESRREEATARARAELEARGASDAQRRRFEEVLTTARQRWGLREENLLYTDLMPNGLIRLAALEIGRRLRERGRLQRSDDAVWLELDELRDALRGADDGSDLQARIDRRRREHAWARAHPGPLLYGDPPPSPPLDQLPDEARYLNEAFDWMMRIEYGPPAAREAEHALHGLAGSPGRITGTARLVSDPSEFARVEVGDVLVCRLTSPDWTVLFSRASAVVTDTGSPLSHAAIVAREHGIPAVVGTQRATERFRDGQTITVDGTAGSVSWDA